MTTPFIVAVSFFVLFLVVFFLNKKKKNVIPPPPQPTEIVPTPEPTPEPEVPIVNEFCYAHEVVVTNSIDNICQSEFFVTVYNLMPNACDEPCQFFLSEEKCKRNIPSWNPQYTYIRCGAKYAAIDTEGRVTEFVDCIF